MQNHPIIQMKGITKRFPGVLANNRVDLEIQAGEVHAILGENGAGKTTLMNVLYGLYQPDEGKIFLRAKPARISSPHDAMAHGIGMVHQHFMLVPVLTVAENIILGLPTNGGPFIDRKQAEKKIEILSTETGLTVDPTAKVWDLPVGVQQRVEILKFLYRQVDLLILDEPTAVLTPNEVTRLFEVLKVLKEKGTTIIIITHKLREVMAVSDRVSVMRDGAHIKTIETRSTTIPDLARMMVGRDVVFHVEKAHQNPGRPILEVHELEAKDDRGLPAVRGISLAVHEGEILGIAGVSGNGQTELVEAILGVRKGEAGRISVCEQDLTNQPPARILQAGVSQIPSDRKTMGSIPDFTLVENAVLPDITAPAFSKHGVVSWKKVRTHARQLIQEFDVRCSGPEAQAGWLSGGNLQKLILAREISRKPKLLIAVQPTRGLDIAAIEFVHRQLLNERSRGAAILLVSTDLDEIMALSDTIAVIYEGKIAGTVGREDADLSTIALMMAGAGPPKTGLAAGGVQPDLPGADQPAALL